MAWLEIGQEQIAVQEHSGQKIIEIVGDASGQTTNRFQPLGLMQTLLGLAVARRVFCHGENIVSIAVCTRHSPRTPAHRLGIRTGKVGVDLKAVALPLEQFSKQPFSLRTIFRMNKVPEAQRSRNACAAAEHLFQRRIERGDVALALALRQAKGRVLKEKDPVPFSNPEWSTSILQQRSYAYFARDDSRKEPVSRSLETLVFLKWEFADALRSIQIPFRAHYTEKGGMAPKGRCH